MPNPTISRFGGTQPTTAIQKMANILLDTIAANDEGRGLSRQVMFPAYSYTNPAQPQQFGDGVQNAMTSWGNLQEAPYVVLLDREPLKSGKNARLKIQISAAIFPVAAIPELEVSMITGTLKVKLDASLAAEIEIDPAMYGWSNDNANPLKFLFFRLSGWKDWMIAAFPPRYFSALEYSEAMTPVQQFFQSGSSSLLPLPLNGSEDPREQLKNHPQANLLNFSLGISNPSQRVHGIFLDHNGSQMLTANGGITTQYRLGAPFKIVQMSKDPRDPAAEILEGTVSGTGPHAIFGTTGETIVNSIANEDLMTFFGMSLPKNGPDGSPLAWNFSHLWMGTWLPPNHVFVAEQGSLHWHLNHRNYPVSAVVHTPPSTPNITNPFGMKP